MHKIKWCSIYWITFVVVKLGSSKFAFLFTWAALVWACKPALDASGFPKNAKRIPNAYAKLFQLAVTESDTFLLLKSSASDNIGIGKYFWGKSEEIEGFVKISSTKRVAALSAVFVGMMEAVGKQNSLVAVDDGKYITSPFSQKRIQSGQIASVYVSGKLQAEQLLNTKPDIVFTYFVDAHSKSAYQRFADMKIPVLFMQNYLEEHPLGRAEWLVLIGWICGKKTEATALFNEVSEHYEIAKNNLSEARNKPNVIVNAPFSGVWDVSGGNSYFATMIQDAGGKYAWKEDFKDAKNHPLSVEKAYEKAIVADVWLNPGAASDLNSLKQMDTRFVNLPVLQKKRIFSNNKLLNKFGGNAYWEYGVIRPDIVLQDLGVILHPEIFSEHIPVFFKSILL